MERLQRKMMSEFGNFGGFGGFGGFGNDIFSQDPFFGKIFNFL